MNYIKAGEAWETSLFLTLEKTDNIENKLPDPKELEKKIQKVQKLLSNN